tara:strand:- start:1243 stop:2079 length:837 start_codon:yes stop_codon:yes gene_type:complete
MKQVLLELDVRSVVQASNRASQYDPRGTILARRSGQELIDRLALLEIVPGNILDLGCGAGIEADMLSRRYPKACVIGVDICPARFQQDKFTRWTPVTGDAVALPLATGIFDLVLANLVLPWCEPVAAFHEIARVLKPGGAVVFSTLGPDTLRELRAAWDLFDDYPHVHPFADMHNVGDALVQAGFSEPVVDVEMLSFTYGNLVGLVDDLRAMGATNVMKHRRRTLTGRQRWQALANAYSPMKEDPGRLCATFEVIYAVAWAPDTLDRRPAGLRVDLPR